MRPFGGAFPGLPPPPGIGAGLSSLTSSYTARELALRQLQLASSAASSPSEWSRLQRAPASFPQLPSSYMDGKDSVTSRERELKRERELRDRERLKPADLSRRSPVVRADAASQRRNSVEMMSSHSRSSLDLIERARSRSPVMRNGPTTSTSHMTPVDAASNRTTPLMRAPSSSSSDVKIVDDPRKDSDIASDHVTSGEHHAYAHHRLPPLSALPPPPLSHDHRLNGFKHDLLRSNSSASKLSDPVAMSRLADYLSPPHLSLTSALDRHRLFPPPLPPPSFLGGSPLDRPLFGSAGAAAGLWPPPGASAGAVELERQRELDRQLSRLSALERESLIDYERKALSGGLGGGSLRAPPLDLYASSAAAAAAARGLAMNHHLHRTSSSPLLSSHHHALSAAAAAAHSIAVASSGSATMATVSSQSSKPGVGSFSVAASHAATQAPPPLIAKSNNHHANYNNHVTSSAGAHHQHQQQQHLLRQHSSGSPSSSQQQQLLKLKSASPLVNSHSLDHDGKTTLTSSRPSNGVVSDSNSSR